MTGPMALIRVSPRQMGKLAALFMLCGFLALGQAALAEDEDIPTLSVKMGVKKEVIQHIEKKDCATWVTPDRGFVLKCDEKVHMVEVPQQEEQDEFGTIDFEPDKVQAIQLPSDIHTAAGDIPKALYEGMKELVKEAVKSSPAAALPIDAGEILFNPHESDDTAQASPAPESKAPPVPPSAEEMAKGERVGKVIMSKITQLTASPDVAGMRPATDNELHQLVARLEKEVAYYDALYGPGKNPMADKSYPYYAAGQVVTPDEGFVMQAVAMHEQSQAKHEAHVAVPVLPSRSVLEASSSAQAHPASASVVDSKPVINPGMNVLRLFKRGKQ